MTEAYEENIAEALWPLVCRIDTVKPMRGNPRQGDIEAAKRSLAMFKQRKPLVANADGTIEAGHHVHAAAVQLGWNEIAVVFCDDDEATARAFALADNRTGDLGRYDTGLLVEQLQAVADADLALLDATSYSQADLDALVALTVGPPPDPDDDLDDDADDGGHGKVCPNCGYALR